MNIYIKTQGTIAQISTEAEFIVVVKTACETLGSVALAQDLGIDLRVCLHIDAAAALGILERRGVGRVRHLDIGVLWLPGAATPPHCRAYKSLGYREPGGLDDQASRPRFGN